MNDAVLDRLVNEIAQRLLERGCPIKRADRAQQAITHVLVTAMKHANNIHEA